MWLFKKKKPKKTYKQKPASAKRGHTQAAVTTHRHWSIGRKPAKQPPKAQTKAAAHKPVKSPKLGGKTAEEERPLASRRWPPEILLKCFEYEVCSWCRKFYTRPTQCPYDRYKLEKCDHYDKIEAGVRRGLMNTPIWQVVIKEAMSKKLGHVSIIKCHYCGATNPEPAITRNWKCYNCDSKL
ncbi:MAG: hypothetical protein U9N44_00690 [Chloroflexota bacterium]|nr:hypothetical protein [Chloroflexota bacterium]